MQYIAVNHCKSTCLLLRNARGGAGGGKTGGGGGGGGGTITLEELLVSKLYLSLVHTAASFPHGHFVVYNKINMKNVMIRICILNKHCDYLVAL